MMGRAQPLIQVFWAYEESLLKLVGFLREAIPGCLSRDTWRALQPCDVLLVRHDVNCAYQYQDKAYAPLCDTLGDGFVQNGLTVGSVAKPFSRRAGVMAHYSPVTFNRAIFLTVLCGWALRLIRGRSFGVAWAHQRLTTLWINILEKAKSRCVIAIQPDKALCRAGKMKNIRICELQHGVIADDHPWYGERTRSDVSPMDLPNAILCWDVSSKRTLQKWMPNKGIELAIIGNPWFSRFANPEPTDRLVHEVMSAKKICNNAKPTILFSLQWGMAQDYFEADFNGVMVAAIEGVILETHEEYNWLLRLHPKQLVGSERHATLSYLNRSFKNVAGVEWERCSQLPLPVVIQEADLHITDSSTCTVEAGWAGIRTGLLSKYFVDGGKYDSFYLHEREMGIAEILPQDKEAIKEWIQRTLCKGKAQSTLKDDYSHSLRKFVEELIEAGAERQSTEVYLDTPRTSQF